MKIKTMFVNRQGDRIEVSPRTAPAGMYLCNARIVEWLSPADGEGRREPVLVLQAELPQELPPAAPAAPAPGQPT